MLDASDTIIACSTPPGRGALSVIRLSGESSIKIAEKLLGRALNKKVNLVKLPLWDGYKEKCVLTILILLILILEKILLKSRATETL